jgi:hypothetical protein
VVCMAPRARGGSVRPRRLSGVVARPVNFTVRAHELTQCHFAMRDGLLGRWRIRGREG